MRASIPALLVLACMVLGSRAALQCVPHREAVGEGVVPCAAGRFVRGRGDAAGRAVARPDCGVERRHFGIAYDPYGTVNHVENVYINNFVAWYLQASPFFRFLAR